MLKGVKQLFFFVLHGNLCEGHTTEPQSVMLTISKGKLDIGILDCDLISNTLKFNVKRKVYTNCLTKRQQIWFYTWFYTFCDQTSFLLSLYIEKYLNMLCFGI